MWRLLERHRDRADLTGVAKIHNVTLPSVADGGKKITLVLTFENVGDQTDQFWWSLDEYEGREGEYTVEYGGGTNIFNRRIEGYYTIHQLGQTSKILTMPRKAEWQLRVYVGHYSDAAKTVQVTDDWKDLTVAKSDYGVGRQMGFTPVAERAEPPVVKTLRERFPSWHFPLFSILWPQTAEAIAQAVEVSRIPMDIAAPKSWPRKELYDFSF
jgi:hypothetical protein